MLKNNAKKGVKNVPKSPKNAQKGKKKIPKSVETGNFMVWGLLSAHIKRLMFPVRRIIIIFFFLQIK